LPHPVQEPEEQDEQPELAELDRNFSPLLCANTLIFLWTLPDRQRGQQTFSSEFRTNSSNSFLHFLHWYSNSGIFQTSNKYYDHPQPRCQ
jgi:hypothetical protein